MKRLAFELVVVFVSVKRGGVVSRSNNWISNIREQSVNYQHIPVNGFITSVSPRVKWSIG